MAPEPNKPKPIQVEDLNHLLERDYPPDFADITQLFDTIANRLDSVYSKIAGVLPDNSSEEDRAWRRANRVSQVEQTLHIMAHEVIERYKKRGEPIK